MTRGDPGGGRPTQCIAKRAATDAARFENPLYHHHHHLTHTNDRTPCSSISTLVSATNSQHRLCRFVSATNNPHHPCHRTSHTHGLHRSTTTPLVAWMSTRALLLPPSPSCLIRAAQHDDNSGGGMLAASTYAVHLACMPLTNDSVLFVRNLLLFVFFHLSCYIVVT